MSVILDVVFGTNDDDAYTVRVTQRDRAPLRRARADLDVPGIIFLEIDGLALPVLRRAMRDGNAPNMARWLADGTHGIDRVGDRPLVADGRQPGRASCSARTTTSRAFRWVEKETGRVMTCSAPDDCAEIEQRLATGIGLLTNGGASRGNLLSGEADEVILTVSRINAEKSANPGYRAFFANGYNVTRSLVLFGWEVILELTAARPGDAPRRAPARPPRRHLPVPARRDVRGRARPDRATAC